MKVQIIKGNEESDQAITKDGHGLLVSDFSGVASDFWALDWDSETSQGEIEWAGNVKPNTSVTSESEIDSALGVSLQTMLDRHKAVDDAIKAAEEAEKKALEEADASEGHELNTTDPLWMKNRLKEYPDHRELIVALYDTADKASIDAKRAAVKAKWPKDNSGPIE